VESQKEDPRAVVMVDWLTMASIWRGISDEDLTSSGVPRSDGKDIATLCPQMTLVRLRRGKAESPFERETSPRLNALHGDRDWVVFSPLRGLHRSLRDNHQGDRADYAVESYRGSSDLRSLHTIDGYRKTVQILRGQSCYRTMQRMTKRKKMSPRH